MEQTKPWYTSFTVWFTIVQGILGVLIGAGVIPHDGSTVAAGGAVSGLSVGTLWGRFRARKRLLLSEAQTRSYQNHSDRS